MGILSTNKKIINLGQGYSAGNGISIDDYVISYTGNEGQLYNAGPNIDIYDDQDQLYISGKDWSADIANASSNAYEQATALIPPEFDPSYISGVVDSKLDSTAFSTVSGDYATTSYVDMSDNLTYSRATAWGNQNLAPLNSVADNSAKWSESTNVVETNSADWRTITAFSSTSSVLNNQVTALRHDLITVITNTGYLYNDLQTTSGILSAAIDYVSANAGDEFPASANDAITAYQTYSGTYLTAHQDISNKLDTTAFSTVSGTFLTAHQDLSNYATTGDLNTASGILSGAIDYLSGNAGKTYTGISPIVVNNTTNEISADSQDITFGEGLDFTNGVLTVTGAGTTYTGDAQGALDEVYANSADWNSNYSTVYSNSSTWTNGGFTGEVYGISGVSPNVDVYIDQDTLWISAGGFEAGDVEVNNYVQTNSASIDDVVSTYETNSGTYLTAHQDISNKLDTTAFSTVSGTFLTAHQDISANEWNSVYDTVESNSGSWAGGGSIDTIPVVAISPLVTGFSGESAYLGIESTALNLSSYVPVSSLTYNGNYLTGVSGKQISSYYTYSAYTARYANNANTANRANGDRNGNEITSYYQPKLTIAGDAGTITAINGSAVGATIPEGWELVGSAGISIVDDSVNNQTIISVTGGGDLSNYYTKTETSSKIELDNAIGDIETLLASL